MSKMDISETPISNQPLSNRPERTDFPLISRHKGIYLKRIVSNILEKECPN